MATYKCSAVGIKLPYNNVGALGYLGSIAMAALASWSAARFSPSFSRAAALGQLKETVSLVKNELQGCRNSF